MTQEIASKLFLSRCIIYIETIQLICTKLLFDLSTLPLLYYVLITTMEVSQKTYEIQIINKNEMTIKWRHWKTIFFSKNQNNKYDIPETHGYWKRKKLRGQVKN